MTSKKNCLRGKQFDTHLIIGGANHLKLVGITIFIHILEITIRMVCIFIL